MVFGTVLGNVSVTPVCAYCVQNSWLSMSCLSCQHLAPGAAMFKCLLASMPSELDCFYLLWASTLILEPPFSCQPTMDLLNCFEKWVLYTAPSNSMCLCGETLKKTSCAWARCNLDGNIDFHAVRVTRAWAVAFAVVEPTHNHIYIYMYIKQCKSAPHKPHIYICTYTLYIYMYGTWIHGHWDIYDARMLASFCWMGAIP